MTAALPPLTLFDFPASTGIDGWESFSPFVLEIARALRLAKLPFETKQVNMMKLKDTNPLGQLPVVAIGDEKVADSTRILERLEAMVPGSMTGGLDARGVAEAWLWEEFADTSLYPYVLATRWVDDRGWPVPRKHFFGAMPAPLRAFVPGIVRRATMKKVFERDFTRAGLDACYERMGRVLDALDADGGDRGALDRAEEHAAERIADGCAEAALEGLRAATQVPGSRNGSVPVARSKAPPIVVVGAMSRPSCR